MDSSLNRNWNRLSNILKVFNDQFGNFSWTDADRVHRLITEEIPAKVAADVAYQNAMQNSDPQNARIEHDKAARRAAIARMSVETEFFKQFSDNESFRRAVLDTSVLTHLFVMTIHLPFSSTTKSTSTSERLSEKL